MNALQIKTFLWKQGLTVTEIAEAVALQLGWTVDTARNAITKLFYHGKYNAELAAFVKANYGIVIKKPDAPQTVREAVRRAA